ncbi:MAG: FAD-binding oxidoreductase [Chloroflexi bacterium]|nr:FAD-binding oxidoreductase [Chloroflexota bacterium]MCY3937937.1 FAD-binding oxidoreductase [Chloroflexota bacterium]
MSRTGSGRLVVAPSTPEELRAVVASCAANAERLHLIEASANALGREAPSPEIAGVSLARMNGILEIDPPNRVARVEPGVSHASLASALEREGLRWPVGPLCGHRSVAETVVTGLSQVQSAGLPDLRHWILGGRWLLGDGTFLGSGGKTIKNSAGYDITRALVGALGFFAIPVELQLRVETIPERWVTGIGSLDSRLLDEALGRPRGVESLLLVVKGDGQATMQVSIAGREADVDAALDGLWEFDVEWEDAGTGTLAGIDSDLADEDREGVKWTAGPAVCARILTRIAGDLPVCSALALPLGRWGIALGSDLDALDELITGNGGEASQWPPDCGAGGVSGIPGFEEFRRAFDPNMVLV